MTSYSGRTTLPVAVLSLWVLSPPVQAQDGQTTAQDSPTTVPARKVGNASV